MNKQPIRYRSSYPALMAATLLFASCQKELNIAEFADNYSAYQEELRIEAVLNAVEPMHSIVRVDRTILVTDTSLFNGRDDDGDWVAETDDTGEDGVFANGGSFGSEKDEGERNGRPDPGEPHVDEYDEIISQLHVSTLNIQLYDYSTRALLIDFAYEAEADSFEHFYSTSGDIAFNSDDVITEVVYYGGYRPTAVYGDIEYNSDYEFRMDTGDGVITGITTPLPPAEFQTDDSTMVGDTLIVDTESRFQWITDSLATVTWVTVERIFNPDSIITVTSHPAGPTGISEDGGWIGEDIMGLYFPGLYRWTVAVPSRAYGAYIYSNLPMRDEQLSNLRDWNDRVVLGIAGSASPAVQYVRIPE
jgi:hypothetical protein